MAVPTAEEGRRGSTLSTARLALHPENRNLEVLFTFFIF
jgi:hypothetical protein